MLCRKPFVQGMQAFPCGQCMPCRFNRRRVWTHRIMLEAAQHTDNAYVTLTYSDENLRLVAGTSLPTLQPRDLQLFLKKLRKAIQPARLRFYAVGEYGDQTERPHYHLALFGFPPCRRGLTNHRRTVCCDVCELVKKTWGLGSIHIGLLERSSAQYIAGYVTKKLTAKDDPRLCGRHPEFPRMSNRPGLGYSALHEIASQWLTYNLDKKLVDVPMSLRHGAHQLPLGRYLRMKLRTMVGKDGSTPPEILEKQFTEVLGLFLAAKKDPQNPLILSQILTSADDQKVASMESRNRIYKKRGSI